jgi:transposase
MQASSQRNSQRRVHDAEFKARVLAECQQPGASVAAVALAHGLNVNLLRKWLVGRGLKRAGLVAPRAVKRSRPSGVVSTPAAVQFVAVKLAAPDVVDDGPPQAALPPSAEDIHVELRRGGTQLAVRWPSSQAQACAVWLRELAATALKG